MTCSKISAVEFSPSAFASPVQSAAAPILTGERIRNAATMLESVGWRQSVAGKEDFDLGVRTFIESGFSRNSQGVLVMTRIREMAIPITFTGRNKRGGAR